MDNEERPSCDATMVPCPIVGIGSSAGGVKALQAFFDALPAEARKVAYVVVMHLDPTHQSELSTILAARTSMPVVQVDRRMPLEPGHVYVIAPDRRLQIDDQEIASVAFDEPRGQRAPIDHFFRSLADQRGDGFAVILTGAGADGAVGVKAVKEAGGLILVQDPNEAEYASMPRSAIATGVADFILPVKEIAVQIEQLLRTKRQLDPESLIANEDVLRRILGHLRARTGHDFFQYKRATVLRRLARRMQVHRIERIEDYLTLFRENVEEVQALFADLLISVTTFFRDSQAFDALSRKVIPALFAGKSADDHLRIWVPGCATGEEAYSIAMLVLEEAARRDVRPQLHIFASDLDTGALATAREGVFPSAIAADVSEDRLQRFFNAEGDHFRIRREVRDIVLFATHSLLRDPPFSRVDLVSCRNLLIYLDRDLQQAACTTFAYALVPGGYLLLGSSENADSPPGLFHVFDREARIYRSSERKAHHLPVPKLMEGPALPDAAGVRRLARAPHVDMSLHRQALEEAAPPSALVNEAFAVIHLSESAGRYFQPPQGPLTSDITELARPELRVQLRAALHRAFTQGRPVLTLPIAVGFNGGARQVHLQVRPVRRDSGPLVALVMFIEGEEIGEGAAGEPPPHADGEALRQLHEELHATRARLKANVEEHEAAIEELRAANEELQSVSEEYRSTAEELETSKEELQSVNEELQTVNNELKLKLDGVSRAHNDLQNLITATDVGTLFLDTNLHIKRFTPRVAELFNVASSDEGRSITDFTHRLKFDRLAQESARVLAELGSFEQEVESENGRWYLLRIRPYRTVHDKIDGVVVTFVDVSARRQAEADLRESELRLRMAREAAGLGVGSDRARQDRRRRRDLCGRFGSAAGRSRPPRELRLRMAREAAGLGVLDYNPVFDQMWWDDRARELWRLPAGATLDLDSFWRSIDGKSVAGVRDAVRNALNPNAEGNIDCEFPLAASDVVPARWVRMKGKTFFQDTNGRKGAVRLINTVQDISDRKQSELNQGLLLSELSHRVKNMLGVVQSMARQTLRGSTEASALAAFEARLKALAGAHELLMRNEWQGTDLAELIHQQMNAHLGTDSQRMNMSGPKVELPPHLAGPFSLLIHELATNAVKHGSLSSGAGSVELRWSISSSRLLFRWEEKGGPRVAKPSPPGFGSYLIEHGLPGASVQREFLPGGLACTIEVPLEGTADAA